MPYLRIRRCKLLWILFLVNNPRRAHPCLILDWAEKMIHVPFFAGRLIDKKLVDTASLRTTRVSLRSQTCSFQIALVAGGGVTQGFEWLTCLNGGGVVRRRDNSHSVLLTALVLVSGAVVGVVLLGLDEIWHSVLLQLLEHDKLLQCLLARILHLVFVDGEENGLNASKTLLFSMHKPLNRKNQNLYYSKIEVFETKLSCFNIHHHCQIRQKSWCIELI